MSTKTKNYLIDFDFIFILFISFLLCYQFIFNDISFGHDGLFHISRLYGISEAFKDGQVIPRIYPTFNNNFGYATPLFYCDFFLIPFALMFSYGMPIVVSFKVMIVFYSTLSVINTFIVSKKILNGKNTIIPYIATILFSFANYHLIDLYVRLALGEIFAISFIPFFFYATYELFIEKKNCWLILGLSFSLLVFSHNLTFAIYCLLFFVFIVLYIFFNINNTKEIKRMLLVILKGAIFGFLLSSWFILPMLEQFMSQSFRVNTYGTYNYMQDYLTSIFELINPTNLFVDSSKRFFDLAGPGFILIVLSTFYLFVKKNKYITSLFAISWVSIICETGIIPIYLFKHIGVFQFLFRLNIFVFPLLTIVSAYVLFNVSNRKTTIFTIVLICVCSGISLFSSFNYYGDEYDHYGNNATIEELFNHDKYINNGGYNGSELASADYLPADTGINFLTYPRHIREVLGDYEFNEIIFDYEIENNGSKMKFTHNFEKDMLIMFPKTYYVGYRAFIINDDGKWTELDTVNVPNYCLVGANVSYGNHTILLQYSGTKIQKISTLVSFSTFIFSCVYMFYKVHTKKIHD